MRAFRCPPVEPMLRDMTAVRVVKIASRYEAEAEAARDNALVYRADLVQRFAERMRLWALELRLNTPATPEMLQSLSRERFLELVT